MSKWSKQTKTNKSGTGVQTTTLTDVQNFQLLFHDLSIGAVDEYVNSFYGIRFSTTGDVSDHGVSMQIQLYQSSASIQIHATDIPGL